MDTELHTGERFHAKLPPVTPNGHINLNVRKHITQVYPFHRYGKQGLESAMRSTPTRIHISELRGDEAMYYLSGVLSSGHPGGITTTHANSPKDAFLQLALLIKQSQEGQGIELEAVKSMLYQTINVVGQLKFDAQDKCRRMTAVYYDPFYRASLLG